MGIMLKFNNVSKKYPNGVYALNKVSFNINDGEFVSIIGPSGSGKSTLLRSINKLITISDGEIYFNDIPVSGQKGKNLRYMRREIGMIFQNYNLVYNLSVLQNVLHGCLEYMSGINGIMGNYSEEDKKRAVALLNNMGMSQLCYERASELSGGQKQRVGIARAIMQDPKLLLCDEPIASLDPSSAKTIMDLLKKLTQAHHITCIVNLHQIDVAMKYASRIIGLSKGSIVFDGKPSDLTEADIEKIYGVSYEDLMIGGTEGAE